MPLEQDVEVSADCLDMLTRVLVAAPPERMSMDEIKTHRWFMKGLPPGALEMNDFLLQGLANQEEVRLISLACNRTTLVSDFMFPLAFSWGLLPIQLGPQPPDRGGVVSQRNTGGGALRFPVGNF